MDMIRPLTKRDYYDKRHMMMLGERQSWEPHWRDLQRYLSPRTGRFFAQDVNKGDRRNKDIIDNTGGWSVRVARAGMMSGLTSPSRPWFRLVTPDEGMMAAPGVRKWLEEVELRMLAVFAKSNFYKVLPRCYWELLIYGTAAIHTEEDFDDVIRFYPFTVGEYSLAQGNRLTCDTLYREIQMTVRNVVNKFGKSNCSMTVQRLYDAGSYDAWVDVIHCMEPNEGRVSDSPLSRDLPIRNVYYEKGQDREDRFLKVGGFHEQPFMAPRWDAQGADVYGYSPGMDSLGDVKMLQHEQRRKGQVIDYGTKPALISSAGVSKSRTNTLPGGITPSPEPGEDGLRPAWQVSLPIDHLTSDIMETQNRIKQAFYVDMFLMMASTDRRQITAREVEERHAEKLLQLGPVVEQLEEELLDPVIDRTFAVMARKGLIPEAPEQLAKIDLKVEYISTLAQAQRAVRTATADQFIGFVGGVSQAMGGSADPWKKVKVSALIDGYGRDLGVPNEYIATDDEVAQADQQEAQMQQAQMALQAGAEAAKIDKTRAETEATKGRR